MVEAELRSTVALPAAFMPDRPRLVVSTVDLDKSTLTDPLETWSAPSAPRPPPMNTDNDFANAPFVFIPIDLDLTIDFGHHALEFAVQYGARTAEGVRRRIREWRSSAGPVEGIRRC